MLPPHEPVEQLAALGLVAFTTTREAGSFGTADASPVSEVMARWSALRRALGAETPRLATASQVHGARVITHEAGWRGWLRADDADGHATAERATAMAVTIADCVPVFLAHPGGAAALLHAGWRGTAARILEQGVHALADLGAPPSQVVAHFGPAICGRCYEVSPDVYHALTGESPSAPRTVDLRQLLAMQARALGIEQISASTSCTRCDEGSAGRTGSGERRFFSHRAGDSGRQLAVIAIR